jgi:hypothetical protein
VGFIPQLKRNRKTYLGTLNVNPEHAVLGTDVGAVGVGSHHTVVSEVADSVIHLSRNLTDGNARPCGESQEVHHLLPGVSTRVAREDVPINIVLAAVPGRVNSSGTVGVGVATGAVHAHDGEGVPVVQHALEITGGSGLGNVHSVVTHDGGDKSQAQKGDDELHLRFDSDKMCVKPR